MSFAYKAFRRPLQDDVNGALEVSGFKELWSKAPSPAGLRWAIVATLISPNFTYRSEQGIPAADARAKGWGKTNTSTSASDYEAVAGGVSVKGAAFTTKSTGESLTDGTHDIYTAGNIAQSFT